MTNTQLERRIEEITYCLGKTLARLHLVEETLQKHLQEQPQPTPKNITASFHKT